MLYSSNEIKQAANAPDRVQFLQDINRHTLPIKSQKCGALNGYSITSLAIALIVGELRRYSISLNAIGRLLKRVDLERLSVLIDQLAVGEISELIVLVPHGSSSDSIPTCVTSWEQVASVARADGASFFPIPIHEALSSKQKGIW